MQATEIHVTRNDRSGNVVGSPPTPGALRQRRYRARRQRGGVRIEIEVVGTALDGLAALGWLDPTRRGDHDAVADAIVSLAARALSLQLRPAPCRAIQDRAR